MLVEYEINNQAAVDYAAKWAYIRNPAFYDFSEIGGDCTSFVSQCLYAGGAVMNYTPDTGWYYSSPMDRAPAWSGVEFFYRFITNNRSVGPFGEVVPAEEAKVGDVLQLGNGERFYHSLLVVERRDGETYIAAHSYDAFLRPLSSYEYEDVRCLHILGARRWE